MITVRTAAKQPVARLDVVLAAALVLGDELDADPDQQHAADELAATAAAAG